MARFTKALEVHFRDIENFDPEFAQDIIDNPDDHIEASIRVLREVLIESRCQSRRIRL